MFSEAPCTMTDADLWFSESPQEVAEAKRLCGGCPAMIDCAKLGRFEDFGVFGGRTPAERQRERRPRGPSAHREQIIRLRLSGAKVADIASRLSLRHSSVANFVANEPELVECEAALAAEKAARRAGVRELAMRVKAMCESGAPYLEVAQHFRLRRGVDDVRRLLQKVA